MSEGRRVTALTKFRQGNNPIDTYALDYNFELAFGSPTKGDTFNPSPSQANVSRAGKITPAWPVDCSPLTPYRFFPITYDPGLGGSTSLVGIGEISGINLPAGRTITGGGHTVGLLGWSAVSGTTPLTIGTEGKLDILTGAVISVACALDANLNQLQAGCTVTSVYGVLVQFNNIQSNVPFLSGVALNLSAAPAAGTTISNLFGLWAQTPASLAGNIGLYALVYQANWTAVPGYANIAQKYVLLNQDPGFVISTAGQVIAAYGAEVVPWNGTCTTGTYEFGVAPLASQNVTLVANAPYISPLYVPQRTTYTKIGVNIVTGQAGASIQLAVYKLGAGGLQGAPIYFDPTNHAATAAGVIETTIAGGLTLEGGNYALVALTGTAGVIINGFTDPGANRLFGSHTSNSSFDFTPLIAATINTGAPASSWPTSPAFIYIALGAYPQVWMRQ